MTEVERQSKNPYHKIIITIPEQPIIFTMVTVEHPRKQNLF